MGDDTRRARAQLSADESGTGTTIVGGQPPGQPRRPLRAIPVGIEKVLYAAAIEPAFREALLGDREAAIRDRGIALESSELAMLRLAPREQLVSAIAALDTSDSSLARRGFLRAVAGAVTLAAGSVLTGCDSEPPKPEFPYAGQPDRGARDFAGMTDMGTRDLGKREWPSAGIDPGFPPRDFAGMTDSRWPDAPAPAGIRPDDLGASDAKKPDK